MTNERFINILGWVATFTAVCMYVSYLEQIVLQPLATAVNCSLWVAYGLLKEKRDYPVALANSPGVVLGLISFFTAL